MFQCCQKRAKGDKYLWWRLLNAPTEYAGVRHFFIDSKPASTSSAAAPADDMSTYFWTDKNKNWNKVNWDKFRACIALNGEMLIHLAGNIFLFSLFVLTVLGQYTGDKVTHTLLFLLAPQRPGRALAAHVLGQTSPKWASAWPKTTSSGHSKSRRSSGCQLPSSWCASCGPSPTRISRLCHLR